MKKPAIDPFVISIVSIIVIVGLFIGGMVYLYWLFPTSHSRSYNWGKQVCVEIKPAKEWASYNQCFSLKEVNEN